ncbi:hypothetical protein LWX53_08870 [bacterium]|nr:hypothetical protein [bacterium]
MNVFRAGRAGVLIGPSAGSGRANECEAALAAWLSGYEVAVCGGRFSGSGGQVGWTRLAAAGAAVDGAGAKAGAALGYVEELRASVAALAAWGADLLVCVGGDGLASYAADAMLASGKRMAMLGVAAGTINAGPIVSVGIENVEGRKLGDFETAPVAAVEVLVDGAHLAYGFNDVVIGDTCLGTVGGRAASLSATALLERGEKVETAPSPDIASADFCVLKNGKRLLSRLGRPAQIVASPLGRREFFARAVAGVLCDAPYMEGPAALALFDSVIVRAGPPERGIGDFSAAETLLFEPGDLVELRGLAAAGQLIIDGNPYARAGGTVGLKSVPGLVDVIQAGRR